LQLLQPVEDCFDAINGGQYERYGVPGDGHAVTKFAHQRFGGVRERLAGLAERLSAPERSSINVASDSISFGSVADSLSIARKNRTTNQG
jgi:hypothetical protein